MQQNLLQTIIGVSYLDLELLLNMRPDDEFKNDRGFILSELEKFIQKSQRFAKNRN